MEVHLKDFYFKENFYLFFNILQALSVIQA